MLWVKAFHIIFVTSWFAGLFYLPRIFVNHTMETNSEVIQRLMLMEQKLYRFMLPLAVLALGFGLWLWLGYGTSGKWVQERLDQGLDVILEIDWQGAQQVKKNVAALSIFILPPTKDALLSRLQGRDQDSEEVINKRMADARDEMSHFYEFDFVVFNDDFNAALEDLKHIIFSARLTLKEQSYKYNNLLKQLI